MEIKPPHCRHIPTHSEHVLYLPLRPDRLGEELHVSELGGGAEGLHALGCSQELLQQFWVKGPQGLLGEETGTDLMSRLARGQTSLSQLQIEIRNMRRSVFI